MRSIEFFCNKNINLFLICFSGSKLRLLKSSSFSRLFMQTTTSNIPNILPSIDLSKTGLTQIDPEVFEPMKNSLKILYLQENNLNRFPEAVCQLWQLENLILDQNILSENQNFKLPINCRMEGLKSLSLKSNRIPNIDEKFCDLFPNLEVLNLRDNNRNLTGIQNLKKCSKLKTVYWPTSLFSCTCRLFRDLRFNLIGPVDTKSSHYYFSYGR